MQSELPKNYYIERTLNTGPNVSYSNDDDWLYDPGEQQENQVDGQQDQEYDVFQSNNYSNVLQESTEYASGQTGYEHKPFYQQNQQCAGQENFFDNMQEQEYNMYDQEEYYNQGNQNQQYQMGVDENTPNRLRQEMNQQIFGLENKFQGGDFLMAPNNLPFNNNNTAQENFSQNPQLVKPLNMKTPINHMFYMSTKNKKELKQQYNNMRKYQQKTPAGLRNPNSIEKLPFLFPIKVIRRPVPRKVVKKTVNVDQQLDLIASQLFRVECPTIDAPTLKPFAVPQKPRIRGHVPKSPRGLSLFN